jgi:hypothetical protein
MWRGKPKAFVRDDFTFYNASLILMSPNDLLISPSSGYFGLQYKCYIGHREEYGEIDFGQFLQII